MNSEDQSTFNAEAPLIHTPSTSGSSATSSAPVTQTQTPAVTAGGDSTATQVTPPRKSLNLKVILITVPIVLVLLLFVAVQIKNSQGEQLPTAPDVVPAGAQTPQVDRSPIQQRLDRLRAELQLAAPTQQEFAFPPVDSTISIDSR
jgi:hypothetical protein